jgi:outer membrane protein assembly factor BamB
VLSEGFALCDDYGSVRLVAAQTGRVERHWQLAHGRPRSRAEPSLTACALSGGRALAAESGQALRPEPLLDQLARVLGLSDPTLTEAQRFLSRELAARPEPEATRVLIDLVTRRSLDRSLQSEAEDLLATRRVGQDHMLAALSDAGSRGGEAPPIAPLGEALAALGERRAAPLLARQLNRPAHTPSALARAAAALEGLASEAEYDELSVFFSLHRTSADDPDGVSAVVTIGRTLLRIGGQKARSLLQFSTRDPLTVPDIKNAIERELDASTAPATGS